MKTQLLQDIGDSHAAPAPAVGASEAPRAAPLPGACGPDAPSPAAAPAPPPSAPAASGDFEGFAFGFDTMDALPSCAAPRKRWIDRWARKVATATMVVIAALLLAVAGAWFYRESMDERAMVVLAKQTIPERTGPAVPAVQAAMAAAIAPALPTTDGPSSVAASTPAGKEPVAEPARATNAPLPEPPARKEGDKAATARLARAPAGTASNYRDNRDSEKSGPGTVAARNEAAAEKRNKLAETLKQCRVAGYHEAQCLKRGCSMTRYGLACKG